MYSLYVGGRVPFRGCFGVCGRDKSVPYSCEQIAITLLTDCDNAWRTFREIHTLNHVIHNEHSANYPHSTTKYTTDIPQIIHIQPRNTQRTFRKLSTFNHVIRCEHTVRRRGPIHRVRIYLLSILWVSDIILWIYIHCM